MTLKNDLCTDLKENEASTQHFKKIDLCTRVSQKNKKKESKECIDGTTFAVKHM